MFIASGYNFCADKNALDPSPITTTQFSTVKLENGIFDHWNVTKNVVSGYSHDIPTEWDALTVMDANFNGNLRAGNIDYALGQISGFNIKRRKTTDFNWINLKYVPYADIKDLSIVFNDNLAQSGVEYEYALVPVVGGVEGNYVSNTIGADFDGVFICDTDTIYRFYAGVQYGSTERVQKIGVFEPYGRRYPVVVSNVLVNYERGSFRGTVLPPNYLKTGNLDSLAMVNERKTLLEFLTNKRAKILKDWNGNSWLCIIVDSPSISYNDNSGMAVASVSSNYVEIGDSDNQSDLYAAGLIDGVTT